MVYVDDMRASFGKMTMCHMVADSREELLSMADRIGVRRKWIQRRGTIYEHFDICLSKRALAVTHGAKEISMHELGLIFRQKREFAFGESQHEHTDVRQVPIPVHSHEEKVNKF